MNIILLIGDYLVLWPSLERRVGLPEDLEKILKQLEA